MDTSFEHPLWETQVSLEKGMTQEGARRVQDAVAKTVNRHQQTRLKPYQDLLQEWLPKVAVHAQNWVTSQKRRVGGAKAIALDPLAECDPHVAALVALRCVLDGMATKGGRTVTALCVRIGEAVEHEQMIRAWEDGAPELYHDRKNRLQRQHADASHTRRVNIHEFNRLLSEGKFGFGWHPWTPIEHLSVGTVLLNCLVMGTGWFETKRDTDLDAERAAVTLEFKPGLTDWVAKQLATLEATSPALKPTVIPPKRWTGMANGGYWTPYVHHRDLIRFKAIQVDQRFNAAQEYNALEMPRVYQALHFLQDTPWRINKRIHAVVREALQRHKTWAGLPDYRGKEVPKMGAPLPDRDKSTQEELKQAAEASDGPIPALMDPEQRKAWRQSEEGRAWRRAATKAKADNAKLTTQNSRVERILKIAEEYKGFDRFYFPHYLDWRGRMYPIPQFLQPQGDDLAKGLLEFAEGKRVHPDTNSGDHWLGMNIASAVGHDKVSFEDRMHWVLDNEHVWRRIERDPIDTADLWTTYDKPWQALAAIFDWVGYLDASKAGKPYQSHAVVSVDGTCNGLQHLSAMTGDEVVGGQVNLIPGDKPQDIYQFVADALLPELERIGKTRASKCHCDPEKPGAPCPACKREAARYWLGFVDKATGKLPRKLAKRPVMILAYSATKDAFYRYTREWLDETDPPPTATGDVEVDRTANQTRTKRVGLIVSLLWQTIQEQLPREMAAMKWLQDCAKVASTGNQPIYWITPDGFVVRHFYGKLALLRVETKLDGQRFQLRLHEPTKDLDSSKQRLGISPNFVHSLDAAAARGCIIRAEEEGHVTAFASVHDSFGTHAADMERLYGYLRLAFVDVHARGCMRLFRLACLNTMVAEMVARDIGPLEANQIADEKLPPLPESGGLDLMEVLRSDYFFA